MSTDRSRLTAQLARSGHALLMPDAAAAALQLDLGALDGLRDSWERLPRDAYLRDGGAYRARRHSCYVLPTDGVLAPVAHRPHWQPTSYNALHGGLTRWFEPVEPAVAGAPAWRQLLSALGGLFGELQPVPCWYIEAHQFRIDTAGGIGRPTPEGLHRDGVDYVLVLLVNRSNIASGTTSIHAPDGRELGRFTLTEPLDAALVDDARVSHGVTAVEAIDPASPAFRDVLVVTLKRADVASGLSRTSA